MDFKIIQDQEHFPLRGADQTIHKLDESVLVHRFLIKHKTNIALAADCRDHIDPLPFRLYWQNGRVTFGREAALYRFTIAYTSFVTPIDHCILRFGSPGNRRIFFLFPSLDAHRILLPGALRRTLAAQAPAPHIV